MKMNVIRAALCAAIICVATHTRAATSSDASDSAEQLTAWIYDCLTNTAPVTTATTRTQSRNTMATESTTSDGFTADDPWTGTNVPSMWVTGLPFIDGTWPCLYYMYNSTNGYFRPSGWIWTNAYPMNVGDKLVCVYGHQCLDYTNEWLSCIFSCLETNSDGVVFTNSNTGLMMPDCMLSVYMPIPTNVLYAAGGSQPQSMALCWPMDTNNNPVVMPVWGIGTNWLEDMTMLCGDTNSPYYGYPYQPPPGGFGGVILTTIGSVVWTNVWPPYSCFPSCPPNYWDSPFQPVPPYMGPGPASDPPVDINRYPFVFPPNWPFFTAQGIPGQAYEVQGTTSFDPGGSGSSWTTITNFVMGPSGGVSFTSSGTNDPPPAAFFRLKTAK